MNTTYKNCELEDFADGGYVVHNPKSDYPAAVLMVVIIGLFIVIAALV